eukprot:351767-Chlamydomonas_euryale.AAC.1
MAAMRCRAGYGPRYRGATKGKAQSWIIYTHGPDVQQNHPQKEASLSATQPHTPPHATTPAPSKHCHLGCSRLAVDLLAHSRALSTCTKIPRFPLKSRALIPPLSSSSSHRARLAAHPVAHDVLLWCFGRGDAPQSERRHRHTSRRVHEPRE